MQLEIVFASLDKTQAEYDSYREKMTWDLAIPYGDELSKKLSAKFKVQGIPTLVILDAASGAVITTDGTDGVREDEDGSAFPYRPRSAWELLGEAGHVIDAKDEKFDVSAGVRATAEGAASLSLSRRCRWRPCVALAQASASTSARTGAPRARGLPRSSPSGTRRRLAPGAHWLARYGSQLALTYSSSKPLLSFPGLPSAGHHLCVVRQVARRV